MRALHHENIYKIYNTEFVIGIEYEYDGFEVTDWKIESIKTIDSDIELVDFFEKLNVIDIFDEHVEKLRYEESYGIHRMLERSNNTCNICDNNVCICQKLSV